jgi:gas vesicle protein
MQEKIADVCAFVNTLSIRCPRKVLTGARHMNAQTPEHRDYGFVLGLLTGAVAGAGLVMWLVPRLGSELRERVTDSARSFGQRASEQYQQASSQVGEAAGELARKGRGARDDVAEAVARGARELERYAKSAKTDRVAEVRKHAAADLASKARSL